MVKGLPSLPDEYPIPPINILINSQVAFAPVWDPENILVVVPTKESWGLFTFEEIQKNFSVHPLNGFHGETTGGKEFRVVPNDLDSFVKGQFYHTILKEPGVWNVSIGTYDMAAFMLLESMLGDKMVYLGPKVSVEEEVVDQVKSSRE
ncbi:hypothetical protein AVEN_237172-1 [Araneus ventricosus]|uniref:Uncharacterized protein n=1 Tax=Araneus ventricosus TaxID=182803 RepID=A0A4Y2T7P2_ARAVE|nr:hypothetical protein AVEN_237172-1 [Araneus ventricosus]